MEFIKLDEEYYPENIERDKYEIAEEQTVCQLKEIDKPFIVLLNCMYPETEAAFNLSE